MCGMLGLLKVFFDWVATFGLWPMVISIDKFSGKNLVKGRNENTCFVEGCLQPFLVVGFDSMVRGKRDRNQRGIVLHSYGVTN